MRIPRVLKSPKNYAYFIYCMICKKSIARKSIFCCFRDKTIGEGAKYWNFIERYLKISHSSFKINKINAYLLPLYEMYI